MAFVEPQFTKAQVNKSGVILAQEQQCTENDISWALDVLANWRACHGYPINTFQATLRQKLKTVDKEAIVAQRLKRAPSIIWKLRRFESMKLTQMQDIAGLRAVLRSVARVRTLENSYRNSTRLKHPLISSKDYIKFPKNDGYRSVHLIYRYANLQAPAYDGLLLELQIRTRLQHVWATAVETMGTFLGQALKTGQGDNEWRKFFATASAAIAMEEKTPPVPGFESKSKRWISREVAALEHKLRVLQKLQGFAIATDKINAEPGAGAYHLIVLNSESRSVFIRPYPKAALVRASHDYAHIEQLAQSGQPLEAVLVSAGPLNALKRAYPNYFLDTQSFVRYITKIIS